MEQVIVFETVFAPFHTAARRRNFLELHGLKNQNPLENQGLIGTTKYNKHSVGNWVPVENRRHNLNMSEKPCLLKCSLTT